MDPAGGESGPSTPLNIYKVLLTSGTDCVWNVTGNYRRHGPPEPTTPPPPGYSTPGLHGPPKPENLPGGGAAGGGAEAQKFTTQMTTTVKIIRTMRRTVSLDEDCDYLVSYCLKTYRTGKICAKTVHHRYKTFINYCMLDYINCRERYEVWQLVHMGECYTVEPLEWIKLILTPGLDCGRKTYRKNYRLEEANRVKRNVPPMKSDDEDTKNALKVLDQLQPGVGGGLNKGQLEAQKFTTPSTTTRKLYRTTPERETLKIECDYLAHYCLRGYRTGRVCGRTIYYKYQSFTNYCMLDYVNCREKYEVWQVVHMGECFDVEPLEMYQHYVYYDDFFLDQKYIQDDW